MADRIIYDYKREKTKRILKRAGFVLALLILAAIVFSIAFDLFLELIQIREIGKNFISVFWKNFYVKLSVQIVSFVILFFVFFTNNAIVKKNVERIVGKIGFLKKNILNIILSIFLALVTSKYLENNLYIKFLTLTHSKPFNIKDPIFKKDIGYFVFERPFFLTVVNFLFFLMIFVCIYTVVLYLLLYTASFVSRASSWDILSDKKVRSHIFFNLILIFAVKIFTLKYEMEGLLYSFFGEVVGVGYTDYYIRMNYFKLSYIVLAAVIVLSISFFAKGKYTNIGKVMLSYVGWAVLGTIISAGFQYFVVSPNEQVYERPFLEKNIKFTRLAYNLENIEEKYFPVDTSNNITAKDLQQNKATVENIRITDFPTTLDIQNQIQRFKQYYIFNDADIAKYTINGRVKSVFISAREINYEGIPTKTYINQKFQYTHGYGVVMSLMTEVTPEGQPKFIIKDIPVKSLDGAPKVTQPRIYYGEKTDPYVIVNTKVDEIDYPEGDSNKLYRYTGQGGIKLSLINRLIFSYVYKDFRLLVSSAINSNSKILINRNIVQRAKKVAPFLEFDPDPYILIDGKGRLVWVLDAYTKTGYFPYSEPTEEGFNYIRNSVKVLIDAYNGTLKFYIIDKSDPIVNVYRSIYPQLFEKEDIPKDIAEHIRYPEYIFKVQASVLKRYHMTNPNVFYNKEDLWDFGKHKTPDGAIDYIPPYYSVMKLPDSQKEELILMVPFTPLKYNTMIAWLAAGSSQESYGKLVLYKFPKGSTVYGPLQVENMIDQDPQISKDLSLWNQGGSKVIRGNLLALPINQKILYIEPIYIASDNASALPEVKRVIAACNGKVVMGSSLSDALTQLIGQQLTQTNQDLQTTQQQQGIQEIQNFSDQILRLKDIFEDAKKALKEGNWEEFGRKFKELDEMMKNIK
ncbi:UPF0182 family membrane protein [Anaerocellum diazotrophicum]|uniref:UPF0182 protein CaldiYA01_17590 n=1 Tax=Caldicellulosiruptor diazotrophicus TaxID=2806205 RepID=A0ABN6ED40_9FIRM|nr:UPF0182 family protein [Caldicellulosiruptor diazotrophicus]BCS81799.1 UPF0182 protein [Caldicellulosiruptor diazotrophicus]